MTETPRTDDHIMVIDGDDVRIECPHGSERHDKSCSYWDTCTVCTAAYNQDVKIIEKLLGEDGELEMSEWIDGTFYVLTPEGKYDDDMTNAIRESTHPMRVRIDVPSHEECLDHGLSSYAWEGDIVHNTGQCFVAEDVAADPRSHVEMAFEDSEHELADGRWVIHYVNLGEDGIEIHIEGNQEVESRG